MTENFVFFYIDSTTLLYLRIGYIPSCASPTLISDMWAAPVTRTTPALKSCSSRYALSSFGQISPAVCKYPLFGFRDLTIRVRGSGFTQQFRNR